MLIQSAAEHLYFLYNGMIDRELGAMVKNNASTDLAHGTLCSLYSRNNERESIGERLRSNYEWKKM